VAILDGLASNSYKIEIQKIKKMLNFDITYHIRTTLLGKMLQRFGGNLKKELAGYY
jgi:hypothetical protein